MLSSARALLIPSNRQPDNTANATMIHANATMIHANRLIDRCGCAAAQSGPV
jgi:hypothetical protein